LQTKWLVRALCAALTAAILPAATAGAAGAATLNGAGSTLVAPLEQEWAAGFDSANAGTTVNYQAIGSGKGLAEIGAGQVDFGASDAPLSASTTACTGCNQMPWALSATGVGFHVNSLKKLHLTGNVLAKIYLGQITNWNDPQIQHLQKKGVHMPSLPITVFFRSDGSGDTYAFADYLSSVSSAFSSQVGRGTKVTFPTGQGAAGNAGMVAALQSTNGGIAYVAVSYLAANWPRATAIKNAAGKYITPNYANIKNAAQSVSSLPSNNEIHLVNPPRRFKSAYVISTYTYVIAKNGQSNNALLKKFIQYAITTGQSFGPRLDFVPIPGFIQSADQSTLNSVN
jgi:phosphate transport system substrate-binding protein